MVRGVKRTASKAKASASSSASSTAAKNKKKRGPIQLEVPSAPRKLGRVLTCGQGDVGQLGLGADVVETTKFKYVSALGDNVVTACAGGMHTVALDKDGKVWTFGCNDEGALGRETSGEAEEGIPGKVNLPRRAVYISAGDSHTAALLDNGDVYAWGSFRDSHGSMGLVMSGREGKCCRQPVKLSIGETGVSIASGGDHLAVLTSTGSVFTLGCGEQGQLGRLSARSASRESRHGTSALLVPAKVNLRCTASRIWAGYHATFALDANNEKMLAWGLNNYGQLGITGSNQKCAVFSPTACSAFSSNTWTEVSPGQHHTLAIDSEGVVYALGRCEYGRLGLGASHTGDAESLIPIPKLQDKKCLSIASGTSNSFCVTDSGEAFAWGMGSEGQLGTGKEEDVNEPTHIQISATECVSHSISAGGQHTVLYMLDPNAVSAPSPVPEPETEEKTIEEEEEEEKEEEEKPKAKRSRKEKKVVEETEVSEDEDAKIKTEKGDMIEKVDKTDKKDTPMEVDETDTPQEKDDESMKTDEPAQDDDKTTESTPEKTEQQQVTTESNKPDTQEKSDELSPKNTEISQKDTEISQKDTEISQKDTETSQKDTETSQKDTEASQKDTETSQKDTEISSKTTDISEKEQASTETNQNDVEMTEEKQEINGTPEEKDTNVGTEIKVSEEKKLSSDTEMSTNETVSA